MYSKDFKWYLSFISLWSNICRGFSDNFLTNSAAELYFHIKKLNKENNVIPVSKYIENNNEFRLSFQCQFVDKFFEVPYFEHTYGINKRLLSNLKSLYENIDISKKKIDNATVKNGWKKA